MINIMRANINKDKQLLYFKLLYLTIKKLIKLDNEEIRSKIISILANNIVRDFDDGY